jgi:hypothetical protein
MVVSRVQLLARQLKRKLWDSKIASSGAHPNLRNVDDEKIMADRKNGYRWPR